MNKLHQTKFNQTCQHLQAGHLRLALQGFEEILNQIPQHEQSLFLMAQTFNGLGKLDDALTTLQRLLSINTKYPQASLLLANIAMRLGDRNQARKAFNNCATSDSNDAAMGLARLDFLDGAYPQAQEQVDKIHHRIPYDAHLNQLRSEIALAQQSPDQAIPYLETALKHTSSQSNDDQRRLLHSLGRLYEAQNDYALAFNSHHQANALSRVQYQPEQLEQHITNIKSVYNNHFITESAQSGNTSTQPVFILGMPRSGTSLVEQILDSHEKVHGAGELTAITNLVAQMCWGGFPKAMNNIDSSVLASGANQYIQMTRQNSIKYVTDKMPHNYLYLGVIYQLFPNAKIIDVVRQPIDTCLSIYFQFFNDSHRYACDLKHIAHHYHTYSELMKYWKQHLPIAIHTLQYETLVDNPEQEIRKLLQFMGLEWSDSCIAFDKNRRHVNTASQQQVNKPLYNTSIEKWRYYEPHIHDLIEAVKKYNLK